MIPQAQNTDYFVATGAISPRMALMNVSPLYSAFQKNKSKFALRGLGEDAVPEATPIIDSSMKDLAIISALGIVACATFSYFTGKAMAPSSNKGTAWGLTGAAVGTLFGPVGLGIMGLVSLNKK